MRKLLLKNGVLLAFLAGAALTGSSPSALAQKLFPSPEMAMKELIESAGKGQKGFVTDLFGAQGLSLLGSGDEAEDRRRLAAFNAAAAERTWLEDKDAATKIVMVGRQNFPFPIPLGKRGDKWAFDPVAGKAEVLSRRIGHNEMHAIGACRAYIEAQKEYIKLDYDGDRVPEFAQRLISSPGRYDGLYWPNDDRAGVSPLGLLPQTEQAIRRSTTEHEGYRFRILTRQGPSAPGGAYSYVINGNMIAGHALLAVPVRYGETGVMSFICGHLGEIHERDLGARTSKAFDEIGAYDPDRRWTRVEE